MLVDVVSTKLIRLATWCRIQVGPGAKLSHSGCSSPPQSSLHPNAAHRAWPWNSGTGLNKIHHCVSTTAVLAFGIRSFVVVGSLSCACRMFSSIGGLHPLDARSTPSFPCD